MNPSKKRVLGSRARSLLSTLLIGAVAASTVIVALRAEGYHSPDLDLHDAGVWITRTSDASVGRVNAEIEVIDTRIAATPGEFDVVQSGRNVLVHEKSTNTIRALDVRLAKTLAETRVPKSAEIALGADTAALLDGGSGRLWIGLPADLASADFEQEPSVATFYETVEFVVGVDGKVHTVQEDGTIAVFDAQGKRRGTRSIGKLSGDFEITAVGSKTVVLDRGNKRLWIGHWVELGGFGKAVALQQPGESAGSVVFAGAQHLVQVPMNARGALDANNVAVLSDKGGGAPIPPVVVGDCAFGAWRAKPSYAYACENGEAFANDLDGIAPNSELRFRTNRGKVILNELVNGVAFLFGEKEPKRIDDWSQALQSLDEEDETHQTEEEEVTQDELLINRTAENRPPVAADDTAATRPARSIVIHPLENDIDPDGDVLIVSSIEYGGRDRVEIIESGLAVQVTPAEDNVSGLMFAYTITDGRGGEASAVVSVTIVPLGSNNPPVTTDDKAIVEAGKSVSHNVLVNDSDPEGDAIALSGARTDKGSVQTRADGTVTYRPPGDFTGTAVVEYEVSDEFNATASGRLTVDVRPAGNLAPRAHNDHAVGVVGRDVVVDVLANDVDPNGDALVLVAVDQHPDATIALTETGRVRVRAERPGSFDAVYTISDGAAISRALLRVDIHQPTGQTPPVAVRDEIVVRPRVPTMLDVLANDMDLDGDILVLQRAEVPSNSPLSVEMVESRFLRITALDDLAEGAVFRYLITDGSSQAVGTVVVRLVPESVTNQPPVAVRDEITVRAGNVTTIEVLANDSDPDGDQLTVGTEFEDVPAGDGLLFLQGNRFGYRAPASERAAVTARYRLLDDFGNRADAEIVIHVTKPDPTNNRPPVLPDLVARTFVGETVTVRVPLTGVDPDGDPVAFLGLADPPTLGQVTKANEGVIQYHADRRDVGGTDRFSYRVRDQFGAEAIGFVLIGIAPRPTENNPPVAVPDTASAGPGSAILIDVLLNDSDPEGDPIEFVPGDARVSAPTLGKATVEHGLVKYRAPSDIEGTTEASFYYTITDGRGATARTTVTVTVTSEFQNEPPIARDDVAEPQVAQAPVTIDVLANDRDPDGDVRDLRIAIEGDGPPGIRVGPDKKIRFTMPDESVGFVYSISDGVSTAKASVQVPLATRLPPVPWHDGPVETQTNTPVEIEVLANDTDPEDDKLHLVSIRTSRNGTAEIDGDKVVFSPDRDYEGDAGFTYEVSDGTSSALGSASVLVIGEDNTPPTFVTLPIEVPADEAVDIDLRKGVDDPDPEDSHTFKNCCVAPAGISARISNRATLHVEAEPDAKGQRAPVRLTVVDSAGNEATGIVEVKVTASSKAPPLAIADRAEAKQEEPISIDVLSNDVDPIGDGLTITSVGAGLGGQPRVSGKKVEFVPASDFFGTGGFTYTIQDASKDEARTSTANVSVTVIGRPSDPAAPTGTPASRQVQLSWGVPDNNGAPIDSYTVESSNGAVRQKCGSNSCLITGLTNGTEYRFRVQAHNRAGDSKFGASSGVIVPDKLPATPGAPTATFGDKQITVEWTEPENEGTPIRGYELEISPPPAGGISKHSVDGRVTRHVWTGLTNGTPYSFRVKATNGTGTTPLSPTSAPETPAGKPLSVDPPTVKRGDQSIPIEWKEPDPNGDPIKEYELLVFREGTLVQTKSFTGADRNTDVGVVNGEEYTVKIRARNKAGWSDLSGPSPEVIPAGVPFRIEGAVTADPGNRMARLGFDRPNSNGDGITRYEVTKGSPRVVADTARVTLEIANLDNGKEYTFQIKACNDIGCADAWSQFSSPAVTPYGAPAQPKVSAHVSEKTIEWTWVPPDGNGMDIDHYEVSLTSEGRVTKPPPQTATSFKWSFDQYDTDSTLSVVAVNKGELRSVAGSSNTATPGPKLTLEKGSEFLGKFRYKVGLTYGNSTLKYEIKCLEEGKEIESFRLQPKADGVASGEGCASASGKKHSVRTGEVSADANPDW